MDPIGIENILSLFINDIDELINQYGKQHFKYQKISPYVKERNKTKYIIEMEYVKYYHKGNWRDEFLDKICKLFNKYENVHRMGLLKNRILFCETTIIKITVDFDKLQ